jgi:hypothetical protein
VQFLAVMMARNPRLSRSVCAQPKDKNGPSHYSVPNSSTCRPKIVLQASLASGFLVICCFILAEKCVFFVVIDEGS